MVRALFFYTFARLTEGASLSLCQKHKVQKHSTTKEQEQERELRGGGEFLFLFPSLFFNYSQPCFCVSTFEECQQSAANQNA